MFNTLPIILSPVISAPPLDKIWNLYSLPLGKLSPEARAKKVETKLHPQRTPDGSIVTVGTFDDCVDVKKQVEKADEEIRFDTPDFDPSKVGYQTEEQIAEKEKKTGKKKKKKVVTDEELIKDL